jgi:hypothetical protein
MSSVLLQGSIGGAKIECGSAAIVAGTGTVTTTIAKVLYAGATYVSGAAAGRQGPWTSAGITGQKLVFRDAGTSGTISYVIIGDGATVGDFAGMRYEISSGTMAAGSADLTTNFGKVRFVHWTYKEAPGTCDQKYWTSALPTATSGNYITIKDTNMNALSADFQYLIVGE